MKTIHKFVLKVAEEQILTLPLGSTILSAQAQNRMLVIYAMVDSTTETTHFENYNIYIYGTGKDLASLPNDSDFVGTVKIEYASLTFHIFCKMIIN